MIDLLLDIPWQFYLIWGTASIGISIYCRVMILGIWLLSKFKYFDTKREIINTILVLLVSLLYIYMKTSWIVSTTDWWWTVLKQGILTNVWALSADWWKQILQSLNEGVIGYLFLHTLTIRRYVYMNDDEMMQKCINVENVDAVDAEFTEIDK